LAAELGFFGLLALFAFFVEEEREDGMVGLGVVRVVAVLKEELEVVVETEDGFTNPIEMNLEG
jgi:hypothetical protein